VDALTLETVLVHVAANLRRRREELHITQEALAEAVELELRYVQKIESGKQNMSLGTLVALANALKVAPADLLQPAALPPVKRGRPRKEPAAAPEQPARKRTRKAPKKAARKASQK
jgi:transcriptional regulator with XRE-family HTH domain